MPFLSVIIPTYNCEERITTCLQSLASQNFKDFEILVIDGISSDNTICRVKSFFENHPDLQFTLISEKDNGIFHAMNKGAAQAKGKWLYFIGSDDWLNSNDVFAIVYPCLSKPDSPDFFYGNALIEGTGEEYDGKFSFRHLLKANICHQSIFITKELFDEFGPFDLRFNVHADWDFNVKVFQAKKNIEFKNTLIAVYGNQGYSSQRRDINFEQKLRLIKEDYYRHFSNRFNSRLHSLKKRIKRYFML
jgi:glycosyltransferase involved in cell wall biosynthesis